MLPPGGCQGLDGQHTLKPGPLGFLSRVKVCDFTNRYVQGITVSDCDSIAGSERTLLEHACIEPRSAAVQESLDDIVAPEFCGQLEAGQPWLRDLQHRSSDFHAVTNTDRIFQYSLDSQVLSERSPVGKSALEFPFPEFIMLAWIQVDGFVRSSMHSQIGLPVSIQIQ